LAKFSLASLPIKGQKEHKKIAPRKEKKEKLKMDVKTAIHTPVNLVVINQD
jgi:hypothetical protein